jgi:sigma-B regulation protein RsbU (phosphoserine phosphatase)
LQAPSDSFRGFSWRRQGDPIPVEKLFEPFFRGDVRDSRQDLGVGLIASQIAQTHGGRIAVTSPFRRNAFRFHDAAALLIGS